MVFDRSSRHHSCALQRIGPESSTQPRTKTHNFHGTEDHLRPVQVAPRSSGTVWSPFPYRAEIGVDQFLESRMHCARRT